MLTQKENHDAADFVYLLVAANSVAHIFTGLQLCGRHPKSTGSVRWEPVAVRSVCAHRTSSVLECKIAVIFLIYFLLSLVGGTASLTR